MRQSHSGKGHCHVFSRARADNRALPLGSRDGTSAGRHRQRKSSPSAGSYQVIWEAVVNIKEHLREDISAASHFSRLFGAVTGMTIPQYIRLLRLRMVCELTESQSLGILDAVYASGFGSTSAYYKALHELVLN